MNIENARYYYKKDSEGNPTDTKLGIHFEIDGQEYSVIMDNGNAHYKEIMRQVDAGELTIAD